MKKQAFLIMAHGQFELLCKLICSLDSEYSDIFLHLDKKWVLSKEQINLISKIVVKSDIFITDRINVMWGGYSQIKAELILLKKAISISDYKYYHLISGQDYLIENIENIIKFYNEKDDVEFINYSSDEFCKTQYKRTKYYWLLRDKCGRNNGIIKKVQSVLIVGQKIIGVNRNKRFSTPLKVGSAYFDISHKLAKWIVSNEGKIRERFNNTSCADECFLQTMIYGTEFYKKISKQEKGVNYRFIDWNGGLNSGPRVLNENDYNSIISSRCFFARKIDYHKSRKLITLLDNYRNTQ